MSYIDQPLRVGLIATPWYSIPPNGYGGVERVVAWLVNELAALGHEITVIGAGTSTLQGVRYLATYDEPPKRGTSETHVQSIHALEAVRLLAEVGVDIVHDHSCVGPVAASGHTAPTIVTAHSPVTGVHARYYQCFSRVARLVAISETQRSLADANVSIPWAGTVYNGIPMNDYPFQATKKDYALWLGKMTSEKAPDLAIQAARAAGIPLILAGKCVGPDDLDYFDEQIKPLLGPDIEWVGEVSGTYKLDLIAQAHCLIFPLRWNEPFGLVMVEAMACGTPVVAMDNGAASELVLHGVTGYLCDAPDELASWIPRVDELDPVLCRKHVEAHFTSTCMAESYLDIYRQALAS